MNLEVFWTKVDCSGECWIWLGAKCSSGKYGAVGVWAGGKTKIVPAHRWLWQQLYGMIESRHWVVHHECRTKLCVRPDHLRLVTQSENLLAERQEVCPAGHPWSPENTHTWHDGQRHCRVCDRERHRAKRREQRGLPVDAEIPRNWLRKRKLDVVQLEDG